MYFDFDEPTIKEGYLMKQGGGTFSSDWRRRWFVLKGPRLAYFKDLKDKQPAGVINIVFAEISIVRDKKKVGGKDFCFQLETKDRTYYCWANTSGDMDSWINTLIDTKNRFNGEDFSAEEKSGKKGLLKKPSFIKDHKEKEKESVRASSHKEALSNEIENLDSDDDDDDEDDGEVSDKVLIIDSGTGNIRAGWSGEMEPFLVFPSVVASYGDIYKVGKFLITDEEMKEKYNAKKTANKRNITNKPIFRLIYPIENGVIKDWNAMTYIWRHIFKTLKVKKRSTTVLLSEPPANPKANREKMVEILFKRFKIAQIYIAPQPVLALFSSGRTAGIVLDCGEGVTQVVPVYDGYIIENAIKRVNWGGKKITESMMKALVERGYSFHNDTDSEVAREIKEELCYVAVDIAKELKSLNVDRSYSPTDKNIVGTKLHRYETVVIGPERFMIPEGLFKPTQIGQEGDGVVGLLLSSIKDTSVDLRKTFYENIIICGGSSMFPNFEKRVERDLKAALANTTAKPLIIVTPDRQNCVWLGGACFATLDTFMSQCLTRDDWESDGPLSIHEKFRGFA